MKYYGKVGYALQEETAPGVWTETITDHNYYGDVIRNNITVANEISIIADPFANHNFHLIRYVEYQGVKWKVTNVEVQRPRLILSMGGVYNGH